MVDRDAIARVKSDRAALVLAVEAAGATFTGDRCRCPFHPDEHPSGGIHEHEGTWRYTCHGCGWNGGKGSGDVFDVIQRAEGCDFAGACERLGIVNGAATNKTRPAPKTRTDAVAARNGAGGTDDTSRFAQAARTLLAGDSAALDHLHRTRGIDAATAERFGIGVAGAPGSRFWVLPVTEGLCKLHRADGQADKSRWVPKGGTRSHLWPVGLSHAGPVWLCPGELKGVAVAGVGRSAVGITSGEGAPGNPADLPAGTFDILRGRLVAIVPDDDEPGRAWGEHVRAQLADAGIEARIVDLGLDKSAGLKDIGDAITRRLVADGADRQTVAGELDAAFDRADPWHGTKLGELWASDRLWRPVEYVATGLTTLDTRYGGGLRTRGVHLFCGKTGHSKSQVAVAAALGAARLDTPVGYLSLELGADEVTQLVASSLSGVPRSALAKGCLGGDYRRMFQRATDTVRGLPLWIVDDERWPGGLDRSELARLVAEGVQRFGWRLVVVDYLGLLVPEANDRDAFDSDLRNSTALRKLARKYDVALLVVAALRKGATSRDANAMTIDDVSGAGRLAYDAQSVCVVSREVGEADCGIVRVRPLKLRFAPCDETSLDIQFRWRPSTGRIEELIDEPGDGAPAPVEEMVELENRKWTP